MVGIGGKALNRNRRSSVENSLSSIGAKSEEAIPMPPGSEGSEKIYCKSWIWKGDISGNYV